MKLTERKAQLKKEKILASAIKIVKKKSFSGATMEEIAAELLLTKGSLYYYFKNKSDLMFQCHRYFLAQVTEELKATLASGDDMFDMLRKMVFTHLEYVIEEKETFNQLMEPKTYFNEEQLQLVLSLRNEYDQLFAEILHRGVEEGKFSCADVSMARMFILGGMNWVQQWYRPDGRLSKEEIKEVFYQYILKIIV